MAAMVWMAFGFSCVSGVMLVSDWIRVRRPVHLLRRRPALQSRPTAPAWAVEELKFVRATDRLSQVDSRVVTQTRRSDDLLRSLSAEAA